MPVEPLEYRPDDHRPKAWYSSPKLLWIFLAFIALQIVTAVAAHRWGALILPVLCVSVFAFLRWRLRTLVWRVDERGIHVPPRFDEPWSRIDSIVTPGPWHDAVHVRLAGSNDERPIGFPAQYAQRIAEIGDKPLR